MPFDIRPVPIDSDGQHREELEKRFTEEEIKWAIGKFHEIGGQGEPTARDLCKIFETKNPRK